MKNFIFLVIIPMILIFFWIAGAIIFNNSISFSVLLYQQPKTDIKQIPAQKLLKGDKIIGEFQAEENYLGLIQLRFNNYVKYSYAGEDLLSFSLKEKGSKKWYVVSYYKSGLLEHNLLFPFGFLPISNSKDKVYQFEIDSLNGNSANAVQVDKNNLTFLTGYQIPKSEILASKKLTILFLTKKFITSFTNLDFLLSSSLYLLPLLLYFLILLSYKWRKGKTIYPLPAVALLLIFLDIFLLKQMYLGVQLLLIFFWLFCVIKYKIASNISFSFAFLLIILWLLFMILHVEGFTDKVNFWTYCFLMIGVAIAIIEEKFKK